MVLSRPKDSDSRQAGCRPAVGLREDGSRLRGIQHFVICFQVAQAGSSNALGHWAGSGAAHRLGCLTPVVIGATFAEGSRTRFNSPLVARAVSERSLRTIGTIMG